MKVLAVLWRFLVDLVVGDDPKVAVGVVSALAVTGAVLAASGLADAAVTALGAVLVVGAFAAVLVVDVRRSRQ